MDKTERNIRQWMLESCPTLLERLEALRNARLARLAALGSSYADRDIAAEEWNVWLAVSHVPGFRELVQVADGAAGPEGEDR
jgi:hypothetical protein